MFASVPTDKSLFDADLVEFIPAFTHPVRTRYVEALPQSNVPPSKIEEGLPSIVQRGGADLDRRIKGTKDAPDFLVKE